MKRILGIICLLSSFTCLLGICLDIAFMVHHFFKLIWWQLGILIFLIPTGIFLFSIFMVEGCELLGGKRQ